MAKPAGTAVRSHAPEQAEYALDVAYRYLDERERTSAEVARRLRREGFSEATIAQALAGLAAEGAVDDGRFARLFAEDKRQLEQWGSERIRGALRKRGVDPETVDSALAAAGESTPASSESEAERALSLLHRRFPAPPRDRRDRERALGVLLRKGYAFEVALEALCAYSRE
ncbi:MAG: regulatory protein RecX [Solirubrobacterales bacterium]|nr:regulatory protein RecX [Solirubrobacterales bacterium]MBV9166738.1 regulatory protein RecX [Solirubrobacterales bacterium]MBV9535584.1 regulatory protein RecX [Solirubrobacterales bacterium]